MLGRWTNHLIQIDFTQSKDHAPHISPMDRARTHRTGFRACVKGARCQLLRSELLGGKPHQICFGMTRAVPFSHHSVFGLQQDPVVVIHQDRPKWMIAVLAGESGDFN